MRINDNQTDAILQIDALAAAARAEEKNEARRTRRKLRDASSALAGEYDEYDDGADCVVSLSGDHPSGEKPNQQTAQDQYLRRPKGQSSSEQEEDTFSYWA